MGVELILTKSATSRVAISVYRPPLQAASAAQPDRQCATRQA